MTTASSGHDGDDRRYRDRCAGDLPLPPICDFDLREAKQKIGDQTTLKGYVDLLYVLSKWGRHDVEFNHVEAMEIAKPGGGWIIGSSDSFREGTPPENLETYWRCCLEYGRYA